MSHLRDDDLVLHYYGEDGVDVVGVERHLRSCTRCAQAYDTLALTLRAVTPPDVVDPPDDIDALRELLRRHVSGGVAPANARPWWHGDAAAIAVAWLVPVLYPWSLPALFSSAQRAHDHAGGLVLTLLSLLWACAGPLVATWVLHRRAGGFDAISTRLRLLGAVVAAMTPPLFLLMARGGQPLTWWYAGLAAAALPAFVPWPTVSGGVRMRFVHRLSATLLGVFVLGHVVNQALGFVSVPSYAAMRTVMRVASQQSISYAAIVTMVTLQVVTGAAMGLRALRTDGFAGGLQAVSGWYLAVFLLLHVFVPLASPPASVAASAASLTPPNLLATASVTAQLPYYLLGVAAFLLHVGVYARLAALAWLTESSVRRLSYAAACAGAMVMVAVGLSLCGIHVLR